jgi:hypothetical protein
VRCLLGFFQIPSMGILAISAIAVSGYGIADMWGPNFGQLFLAYTITFWCVYQSHQHLNSSVRSSPLRTQTPDNKPRILKLKTLPSTSFLVQIQDHNP